MADTRYRLVGCSTRVQSKGGGKAPSYFLKPGNILPEDVADEAIEALMDKGFLEEVVEGEPAPKRKVQTASQKKTPAKKTQSKEGTEVAPLPAVKAVDPAKLATMDLDALNALAAEKGAKSPFKTTEEAEIFLGANYRS